MSDYKAVVEQKKQAILDVLIENIERNSHQWEKGWFSMSQLPVNAATNKRYQGINAIYLYMLGQQRGYTDPRWVTFNQAHDLGASIKPGEHSTEVMFWSMYDKATKKAFDAHTLDGMSDDEKLQYRQDNVRPVLKFYNVFNAQQCNNFPELQHEAMSDEQLAIQNARIENVIANSAAPVKYDGGSSAYYRPSTDDIHLPEIAAFKTKNDYYATALHEIAHSTGHPTRLNRDISGTFGSSEYAIEELRAELSSVFMQTELGIRLENVDIPNHAAYLKSWLAAVKDDKNIFYRAASDASRIVDYIKENYLEKKSAAEITQEAVASVQQAQNVQQDRQVKQGEQVELVFPKENRLKDYGKSTMLRLPKEGAFASFVFLAPTSMLRDNGSEVRLVVPADFTFNLTNDGRQVQLTGQELRTYLDGKEIGKSAQRIAPSKKNAERLENLKQNVPEEMKAMPNWCVYRTKWNEEKGKKDKFNLSPIDGKWAKVNDSSTWTDFDTAYKYALDNNCEGLTFVLDGSGISCIDLDKCITKGGTLNGQPTNKAEGEMNDAAKKLMAELGNVTYTERSASGNGLHFFLMDDLTAKGKYGNVAKLPGGDEIEVYSDRKFISMTGDMQGSSKGLSKCPSNTTSWLHLALGLRQAEKAPTAHHDASDDLRYQSDAQVLERIRASKKGSTFETLYNGGSITGDRSRDDLAMLNMLAFFTDCNEAQMESIFKSSARFRPETKSAAYLSRSIRKACDSLSVRFGQGSGGYRGDKKGK